MNKICNRCKVSKDVSMYSKNKLEKDGLCNRCKECNMSYHWANREHKLKVQKEYREKNKVEINLKSMQHYRNNLEGYIFRTAKTRARNTGKEFNLDKEDIVIPKICPVLGIPIVSQVGKHKNTINSPSLDRLDNTRGYVKGNVWIISKLANSMKNEATPEQLKAFANWVNKTYK